MRDMKWMSQRKAPAARRRRDRTMDMAQRRSLVAGRVVAGLLAGSAVALLLAGVVFLSNSVTGLRSQIAALESHKCCLEAASADLQVRWNQATRPTVIRERARRELGLIDPGEPALVLVRAERTGESGRAAWTRVLDRIGGGQVAQASEAATATIGPGLVSLVPRAAAGTVR